MNKLFICMLPFMLVFWSCNTPDAEGDPEATRNLKDTATAASAPLVEKRDTTKQEVQELELHALGNTLDEIRYAQDTLHADAGALVRLKFVNEGVDMPMVHNVVFTAPGKYKQVALAGASLGPSGNYVPQSEAVIAASPMALPGQTVEVEFTAPKEPGLYDFVCTYPGHWEKMNGVLVVQ
ncbi:plastocyanin/azurin family copper-binding protein [Pontibacter litorisediminis]|uniref:plastocyanin/azurin family copper-binding protein n=1 Tax=Pontibacter litorisediminis TaxID=1846260 RepID=UPI0023EC32A8|nr:plastocyanin/azurin family copper-binding protein [Pontibacter litorisediminis]